jgi:UDP-N-acetylglucosamine 2-epimerase
LEGHLPLGPNVKLLHVVGARPNFPKLASVHRAGQEAGIAQVIVRTGQHYDDVLSADLEREFRGSRCCIDATPTRTAKALAAQKQLRIGLQLS